MKVSLVMATRGRTQEIGYFLASLDAQTYRDFELIVVDQNPDDRLVSLLSPYHTRFPVLHLRSEPGVSRARNTGLSHVKGEIVGFPDDDCRYPSHLLEQVIRFLGKRPHIDGVTGRVVDQLGATDARFDSSSGLVTLTNIWQRAAALSVFLRSSAVEKIGNFDETLGPGSGTIWGGAEDIDYALRTVLNGLDVYYDPGLVVFHQNPLDRGFQRLTGRAYAYGAGIGRVWRKHNYPLWLVAYYLLRPGGGAVLSLITGQRDKAHYHWSAFRGRLRGWLST